MTDQIVAAPSEDRTMPAVAYALYLLGLTNGLTIIIGLIVAYVYRDRAGPRMRTHYDFLIRTFWMSIGWFVIGGLLLLFGAPLSLILVGVPIFLLGLLIWSVIGIWFGVRSVVGVIYLARDEAYPRPATWFV